MRGSIREVKALVTAQAYDRIKPQLVNRDWCIVGMDQDSVIIRIERTNRKFSRSDGKIKETHQLPEKRSR